MLPERERVLQEVAPNGKWTLTIEGPTAIAPHFYADFRGEEGREFYMFPFGFATPAEQVQVLWDLPNHVCGLFLGNKCYGLFYYGPKRRRIKRERARLRVDKPFNEDAIAWFTKREHELDDSR